MEGKLEALPNQSNIYKFAKNLQLALGKDHSVVIIDESNLLVISIQHSMGTNSNVFSKKMRFIDQSRSKLSRDQLTASIVCSVSVDNPRTALKEH